MTANPGRIKSLLPGQPGWVGVTAADNRLFVEAVLYRYRAGLPWRDLPERFGEPSSARQKRRSPEKTVASRELVAAPYR